MLLFSSVQCTPYYYSIMYNTKQRKCTEDLYCGVYGGEAGSGGAVTRFGTFLSLKLKIPALLDIVQFIASSAHAPREHDNTRTTHSPRNVSDQ